MQNLLAPARRRLIMLLDRLAAIDVPLPELRALYRRRNDHFAEFLPDTDGIVETRHSPVAGYLIFAIAFMVATILLWAGMTEVEQVVHAEGQVEPAGKVKIVNHPGGGKVAEILVSEGEQVLEGQPLLAFDSEIARAALDDVVNRWQLKAAEVDRLRAEVMDEDPIFGGELPSERPDLIIQQTELLAARRKSRETREKALSQAIRRQSFEVDSLHAELGRLQNSENMMGHQVGAVRRLSEQGLYPKLQLIAAERQLGDITGDIRKTQARLASAEAALSEARSERDGYELEWRSIALAELAELEAERDSLAEARRQQETMLKNLVLRAPAEGIIQELVVAGAGQSVGSNQPLMKLVPTGNGLVIRAHIENEDIGYLRRDQPVKVKVRAFDFLRYGMLNGKVERIAADATFSHEDGAHRYDVMIETEDSELTDGDEWHSVVPGMRVDVDLLVRERTILSYLTDRIFKLPDQVFREG